MCSSSWLGRLFNYGRTLARRGASACRERAPSCDSPVSPFGKEQQTFQKCGEDLVYGPFTSDGIRADAGEAARQVTRTTGLIQPYDVAVRSGSFKKSVKNRITSKPICDVGGSNCDWYPWVTRAGTLVVKRNLHLNLVKLRASAKTSAGIFQKRYYVKEIQMGKTAEKDCCKVCSRICKKHCKKICDRLKKKIAEKRERRKKLAQKRRMKMQKEKRLKRGKKKSCIKDNISVCCLRKKEGKKWFECTTKGEGKTVKPKSLVCRKAATRICKPKPIKKGKICPCPCPPPPPKKHKRKKAAPKKSTCKNPCKGKVKWRDCKKAKAKKPKPKECSPPPKPKPEPKECSPPPPQPKCSPPEPKECSPPEPQECSPPEPKECSPPKPKECSPPKPKECSPPKPKECSPPKPKADPKECSPPQPKPEPKKPQVVATCPPPDCTKFKKLMAPKAESKPKPEPKKQTCPPAKCDFLPCKGKKRKAPTKVANKVRKKKSKPKKAKSKKGKCKKKNPCSPTDSWTCDGKKVTCQDVKARKSKSKPKPKPKSKPKKKAKKKQQSCNQPCTKMSWVAKSKEEPKCNKTEAKPKAVAKPKPKPEEKCKTEAKPKPKKAKPKCGKFRKPTCGKRPTFAIPKKPPICKPKQKKAPAKKAIAKKAPAKKAPEEKETIMCKLCCKLICKKPSKPSKPIVNVKVKTKVPEPKKLDCKKILDACKKLVEEQICKGKNIDADKLRRVICQHICDVSKKKAKKTPPKSPPTSAAAKSECKKTEPEEAKPKEAKPKEAKPKEAKPKEAKPKEAKPKEAKPKEVKPKSAPAQPKKPEKVAAHCPPPDCAAYKKKMAEKKTKTVPLKKEKSKPKLKDYTKKRAPVMKVCASICKHVIKDKKRSCMDLCKKHCMNKSKNTKECKGRSGRTEHMRCTVICEPVKGDSLDKTKCIPGSLIKCVVCCKPYFSEDKTKKKKKRKRKKQKPGARRK